MVADIPPNFIGAIKQTEGYDARPRWDVKQWTVGYGTRASGPDERIDPAQAEARFNAEITKAANIVDSVNPNLDPGTRAALTSLTFNAGDAWTHSGLGEKIRSGDLNGAKELFLQYNKAGGETNDALSARRAREASWFGRGDISPAESIQPRIDRGTAMLRIMDDPDLANRPQVQAAALAHINKIYEAYHFQDSQQSAAFSLKLNGSVAELRDTGQLTNPIQHEEFLNGFGPTKGEAAWQDYQKDVQLGADMRSLAGQSPEEIAATYARYANPTPGDDYGTQAQRRDQLTKAIEQNQKARDQDPAGFVIRRTNSGQASWKQFNELIADKNATPGMRTAYAQMFASKMLAEQERLGVPAEARTVAPDWYTSPIKDQIAAAATSDDPQTRQGVIPLISAQKDLVGQLLAESCAADRASRRRAAGESDCRRRRSRRDAAAARHPEGREPRRHPERAERSYRQEPQHRDQRFLCAVPGLHGGCAKGPRLRRLCRSRPQARRALRPRWHGAVGGRDQGLQRPRRQPLRFPRYLAHSEKPADQSR